jgi:hypothetical protein
MPPTPGAFYSFRKGQDPREANGGNSKAANEFAEPPRKARDTNISVVVVPKEKWEIPIWLLLPLHQAIAGRGAGIADRSP